MSGAHGSVAGVTDGSSITVTQQPTQGDVRNYSVSSTVPTQGNFTFSTMGWGYFNASNVFVGTGASLGSSTTLALSGTAGKKLKVEFLNTSGVKKEFLVTLSATQQNFTFDLTGFTTAMAAINLVSDELGTTDYVVSAKKLSAYPVVAPATMDLTVLTPMPNNFSVYSAHGSVAGVTDGSSITLTGPSVAGADVVGYNVTSNVPTRGNFTFSSISWGYFDASNVFQGAGANLGTSVTLAMGVMASSLKVEFVNTANVKKVFTVAAPVAGANYTFDLTGFTGPIAAINFVGDEVGPNQYVFAVKTVSTIPVVAGDTYSQAALSTLPGTPVVNSAHGTTTATDNATITTTQTSSTTYGVTSVVPDSGDFTFSSISWGYFNASNVFQGTGGSLGTSVILALNGTVGKKVKIEFLNTLGVKKEFLVTLAAAQQNFTFDLTGFTTTMAAINFVSDEVGTTDYTVETKGLKYVSAVTGSTYNYAGLTSLAASNPVIAAGSGNITSGEPAAVLRMTQNSANEFEYEYDLSPSPTCFAFNALTLGGVAYSLPSAQYVFAARGSDGERTKIEITDASNNKATFVIQLTSSFQNFTLNIPAGVNYAQIKEIVFVQDHTIGSPRMNDFVRVQTPGLSYAAPTPVAVFEATKAALVQEGLDYFDIGVGVDSTTHFPYDNLGTAGATPGRYTQPTLIGFYLQILGDVVSGKISNGMTRSEALTEINTVMTNLRSAQTTYGWNGMIPWLNLNPTAASGDTIALGDNANLSQSIAVMVGALESAGLTGAELTSAQQAATQADQYLNNQAAGYASFVDGTFGIFRAAYDVSDGAYSGYIDRLANEFRGAVAFLAVYYAGVPNSVWSNLATSTNDAYTDRNGVVIENLAPWDGGAFQTFWPALRNDESSYIGFRNSLYNMLATQLDYAYQNRIPGILSASMTPEGSYAGGAGIPEIAEANMVPSSTNTILGDVGSTYALASARAIDHNAVLGWLYAIDNLVGTTGSYGLYDGARSSTEVSNRFLGIDVASTILGLSGNGPADFTAYLRNRGLENAYNTLYDSTSRQLNVSRTTSDLPSAPEFPDRSMAVFSNLSSEGTINHFQAATTQNYGVRLAYTNLLGVDGGHFWMLDQNYNAQANQLILQYSAVDSPQLVRLELKDGSGTLLYQTTVALQQGAEFARLVIDLPDDAILANVREIDLVADAQEGGDATADFTLHAMNFQHVPSAPVVAFTAEAGSPAVTVLPANSASVSGVAQLVSSSAGSTLQHTAGTNLFNLHFDLTAANAFAEIKLNFDPSNNGSSADLSAVSQLIFGINSATATNINIEIQDAQGNTYRTSNTDIVGSGYYKFLTALAAAKVDLSKVKSIKFGVDQYSVLSGTSGNLLLEIGGLQ
ncbi:MAG: hypothetical protein V1882_00715 [Candidatus Omnitrophota bacterium]